MNKKILYIIFLTTILFISGCDVEEGIDEEIKECEINSDCVKDTCCHSDKCVNVELKPNCDGVICTNICQLMTLDCGGSCSCVDNKCIANIKSY